MIKYSVFILSVLVAGCTTKTPAVIDQPLVFVGTYTQKLGHVDGKASGVYTCRMDTQTGQLTVIDSTTDIANPSFVCLSPDKKILYAVGENGGKPEQPYGSVAAYQVQKSGKLLKINEVPSYGVAPCHVSTDHTGKYVFVANYATGNIISYGVRPDGGLTDSLCTNQHPGEHPWAHQVRISADNHLLWAVDKGADRIFVSTLLPNGILKPTYSMALPVGSGPRHLDFYPSDPTLMAVINEINCTVLTFRFDAATGNFSRLDSLSTLPAGYTANNSCADLHFHPNGRFLYGSNRGHNSIVIYSVDAKTGKLSLIGHVPTGGAVPRNFHISPDGQWLLAANQNSGTIAAFKIDATTGMLTPTGSVAHVATPVCVEM